MDAGALRSRGLELYKQGKLEEALTALRKANELEDRHAWAHNLVGMILSKQAKPTEAIQEFRQAMEFAPDYPPPFVNLGMLLLNQGKLEEGITVLHKGMELQTSQLGPDNPQTLFTMTNLAAAYVRFGKLDRTLPLLEKILKRQKAKLGPDSPLLTAVLTRAKLAPDNWKTFHTKSLLGGALLDQKKYAEAEAMLLAGYEGMKKREAKIPPQGKVRLTEAVERLVQLYEATDKKDEAAKWRKEWEARKPPSPPK